MKRLLLILGAGLGLCMLVTLFINNAAHQTTDVLGEVNLGKSLDLGREINDSLQISLGIVDRLVWVNVLYGLVLAGVVIAAIVAISRIVRGVTSHRASEDRFGQLSSPHADGPHYLVLGQRGVDYLMRLPAWQREQVLAELVEMIGQVQQSLGQRSKVKLLDQRTGKETRWG